MSRKTLGYILISPMVIFVLFGFGAFIYETGIVGLVFLLVLLGLVVGSFILEEEYKLEKK